MTLPATIRCTIREHRRRKGLSQDELARLAGVRRQAIYDMEAGRYLPNTAVALRLARALDRPVEMLFVEEETGTSEIRLSDGLVPATGRVALAQVREKIVGIPLEEKQASGFRLEASDGLLHEDARVELLLPRERLIKTVLLRGCDPALNILGALLTRMSPGIRAHTVFASSRQALQSLADGEAHVAGTHFHGDGGEEANVAAARAVLPDMSCLMLAFSLQEEGFMVTKGNPLAIRGVEEAANRRTRIVNREQGAALRRLLDTQLARRGIPASAVSGYATEAHSHAEGAFLVASGAADAALGLRVVAEAFGLDFVPLAVTRCDVVIPADLCDHVGVAVMLDMLQSASLRKELGALPGYDASLTGKLIMGKH